MEISKEEAQIILKSIDAAWEDGKATNRDAFLVQRIIDAYPALEVPAGISFVLDRALMECDPYILD